MKILMELIEIATRIGVASIIIIFLEILIRNLDKCYIYVSYEKNDRHRVEFAIEVMKKQVRRKWGRKYKVLTLEDIPVGNLVDLTKRHFIKRSETCIIFLSHNFIKNSNLNKDIALMEHAKVIPVFLDWDNNVLRWSEDITNRKGVFLVGCYSHRIIEYKIKSLVKEL